MRLFGYPIEPSDDPELDVKGRLLADALNKQATWHDEGKKYAALITKEHPEIECEYAPGWPPEAMASDRENRRFRMRIVIPAPAKHDRLIAFVCFSQDLLDDDVARPLAVKRLIANAQVSTGEQGIDV